MTIYYGEKKQHEVKGILRKLFTVMAINNKEKFPQKITVKGYKN